MKQYEKITFQEINKGFEIVERECVITVIENV